MTSLPSLAALRLFSVALVWSLSFALASGCGGDGTPAPESAHEAAHPASRSEARDSDEASDDSSKGEDEAASAPSAGCDDGTCFVCGAGSCPQGWYCDESAQGGAACSWLPECAKKTDCSCVSKVLGGGCSCSAQGGGLHVECK